MSNVAALPVERKFPAEGELAKRITAMIHEYDGQVSLVSAVGVLELVKFELLKEA